MVKHIPLTRGRVAIVDDEDYDWLSKFNWSAKPRRCSKYSRPPPNSRRKFYATRISSRKDIRDGKPHLILMHRVIAATPEGLVTDHINGDTLDNRRENLRICTPSQNAANKRGVRCSSSYKGVIPNPDKRCKRSERWRAQIQHNRKHILIGYFASQVEAAEAYDAKAKELFGEFARINFEEAQ